MWLFLATALLIGVAAWARSLQRTWAAPGAFFALIWIVAAAPTAVTIPKAVTPGAILLVASFVLAVLLGSQIPLRERRAPGTSLIDSAARQDKRPPPATLLAQVTAFLGVCGIAACVGYVWDAGYDLSQLADGSVWLDMAVHYAVAHYHDDYVEPLPIRVLLAANYAGAFTGGVLLATGRGFGRHLLGALPVVAGSIVTVITTAKSSMLLTVLFTFAGWLSYRATTPSEKKPRRTLKQWFGVAALFAVLAVVGTASLALRYGEGTDSDLLTERVGGYLYGHMAALSAWLTVEDWGHVHPTRGALTFAGPAEILDLAARTTQGFYNPISLNEWSEESNVFTALRGAITDFGLFGAWLLAVFLGAFAGSCYARLHRGDGGTAASMTGLAVFYGFAAWSPIVSIFSYNVIMLAIVIVALTIDASWSEIRRSIEWSLANAAPPHPYSTIQEIES